MVISDRLIDITVLHDSRGNCLWKCPLLPLLFWPLEHISLSPGDRGAISTQFQTVGTEGGKEDRVGGGGGLESAYMDTASMLMFSR